MFKKPKVTKRIRKGKGVNYTDYCINLGSSNGRRIKYFRKTKEEAESLAKEMYIRLKRQGVRALSLTNEQLTDSATAISILRDAGCWDTLTKIAKEHVLKQDGMKAFGVSDDDIISFGTFVDSYRSSIPDSLSISYRRGLTFYLRRLEVMVGRDAPCGSITPDEMSDVLERISNGNPTTFNNAKSVASTLFLWGIKKEMVSKNPLAKIDKKKVAYREPSFLKAGCVSEILKEGMTAYNSEMYMPWLILGFFCGIRSAEITRLRWEDVRWEDCVVRVAKPKGEQGTKPRYVTLNETAKAWLSIYKKDNGLVGGSQGRFGEWRRSLKSYHRITEATEKDGAGNIMRHTFCTMHFGMYKDIMKTATEMGHYENVSTTLGHYRSLATTREAEEFWALRPPNSDDAGTV